MSTRVFRPAVTGILIAVMALALVSGTASGQAVSVGTNPPGSVFYTIGSGLAKVVSEAGPVKMSVQPYAGSSTFIPLLNSGELEFGVNNAVDMALAYRGPKFQIGERSPFPHGPNTRPIRFYRERGVWTPAMDQTQQKLLAINP